MDSIGCIDSLIPKYTKVFAPRDFNVYRGRGGSGTPLAAEALLGPRGGHTHRRTGGALLFERAS
eukprot:1268450-Pyramimonas_sp.AAC.1